MKSTRFRETERAAANAAYDKARKYYEMVQAESVAD
jgi:hypothetical protein